MFKPTYLYIKTHNITGLKYFGKTTRTDPYSYKGSGSHWVRHINKHGYNVTTEILGYYTNKEECIAAALEFSLSNNIVESVEWANLRTESLDGGDTSKTENYLKSLPTRKQKAKLNKWWNNGSIQKFRPDPPDETYVRGRLEFNNIGAKIGTDLQRGKFWVTNGANELMISPKSAIPYGYRLGRIDSPKKNKPNLAAAGTKWWNNGEKSVMRKDCPGPEWSQGRL